MNFDFSALLVLLSAVSGLIWAADAWFFKPARDRAAAGLQEGETPPQEPLLVDYARSFFPVFFIVLLLRSFLFEPFRIPSASMMPTLLIGDFILVNKYDYGIRLPVLDTKIIDIGKPKRGDVVVFRYPKDPSIPFIKRVIGIPGDHLVYKDKTLYINGVRADQKTLGTFYGVGESFVEYGLSERQETLPGGVNHDILLNRYVPAKSMETTVPKGEYFVMGDNRDNSKDSRYWGFVPDQNLIGRATLIWMNWDIKNGGINWSRIGTILH
ncbi:MAG: signal peptidase I [Gammaproteobacteria bacterium]|jgi:signal peptidase I